MTSPQCKSYPQSTQSLPLPQGHYAIQFLFSALSAQLAHTLIGSPILNSPEVSPTLLSSPQPKHPPSAVGRGHLLHTLLISYLIISN